LKEGNLNGIFLVDVQKNLFLVEGLYSFAIIWSMDKRLLMKLKAM
jgi:hypothetical protein